MEELATGKERLENNSKETREFGKFGAGPRERRRGNVLSTGLAVTKSQCSECTTTEVSERFDAIRNMGSKMSQREQSHFRVSFRLQGPQKKVCKT